jgi:catechol 2,3-dioxygenase-like lactoylglutathione lyase family enzyme
MPAAITGIDHVVIAVDDLDRAEAAYRRLGFTLSPRAVHSATMGTANHTIMLEHDYFELLAVLTPTLNAPATSPRAPVRGRNPS